MCVFTQKSIIEYCGYSVDVGQVETFEKNSEGKTIRKNFEVDFV